MRVGSRRLRRGGGATAARRGGEQHGSGGGRRALQTIKIRRLISTDFGYMGRAKTGFSEITPGEYAPQTAYKIFSACGKIMVLFRITPTTTTTTKISCS